jgi:uncharacterized protein YjbI with pentapeptide repeats
VKDLSLPDLPDLDEGLAGDLGVRSDLSAMRFSDLDLSGQDVSSSRLIECALSRVALDRTKLGSLRLVDCLLENLDVPVLLAARPMWRGVVLRSSRIGSAELYDGEWTGVLVSECRLGYLNFRHGTLTDVRFTDCRIAELDLSGTTVSGLRFEDCEIETLTITGARFKDVDLRGARLRSITGVSALSGATIDEGQLVELAPLLAAEAGIAVAP